MDAFVSQKNYVLKILVKFCDMMHVYLHAPACTVMYFFDTPSPRLFLLTHVRLAHSSMRAPAARCRRLLHQCEESRISGRPARCRQSQTRNRSEIRIQVIWRVDSLGKRLIDYATSADDQVFATDKLKEQLEDFCEEGIFFLNEKFRMDMSGS